VLLSELFKDLVEGIFRSGRRLDFTAREVCYDDINAEKPAKTWFLLSRLPPYFQKDIFLESV